MTFLYSCLELINSWQFLEKLLYAELIVEFSASYGTLQCCTTFKNVYSYCLATGRRTESLLPQHLSQITINNLPSMNVEVSVEVFCYVNFNKTFVVLPFLRCSIPTASGSHLNRIYLTTSSITHLSTKLFFLCYYCHLSH